MQPLQERMGELVRTLVLAEDRGDALRAWLSATSPSADVAIVARGGANDAGTALRRSSDGWAPVSLPPVPLPEPPDEPRSHDLSGERRDALDDLLASLGMRGVLLVPLDTPPGDLLVLARARGAFDDEERREIVDRAPWLAAALIALGRTRARVEQGERSALEVAALLDLSRDLARPVGIEPMLRAAARALQQMLEPAAGGLLAQIDPDDRPAVATWPDGATGEEIAMRLISIGAAAGSPEAPTLRVGVDPGLTASLSSKELAWISPERSQPEGAFPLLRIVLGWSTTVPVEAHRVAEAVDASLRLALDRRRAERHREKQFLGTLGDALPQGVALMSQEGRLRRVNAEARRLLEAIGAWPGPGGALTSLGSVDLLALARDAARGARPDAEVILSMHDRTIELRVRPSGTAGEGSGPDGRDVLLVLDDVTEAKRRRRQLAQAERLSALGVMISGIVHEINNPLSTILGYAEMLQENPDTKRRTAWLETLGEEAQRCQRLVSNMLLMARDKEPTRQAVSIGAAAERALSLLSYQLKVADVEASLQQDPDTPAIEGDPDALLQLFINLLTNALHALESREGPRRVGVDVRSGGEGVVCVVVNDNGPGIPASDQAKMFDPFFTTKPEDKGTGLGLSLVAATVRQHGGEIDVTSGEGRGARFEIRLPVGEPSGGRAAKGELATSEITGLEGRHVLVADDEPAVASLLSDLLTRAGAHVTTVGSGDAALSSILTDKPDVVVADLRMPRLDGKRLLAELGTRAPLLVERVIFSTGELVQPEDSPVVERLGRPCLVKPFDLAAVVRTVREIDELSGATRPVRGDSGPPDENR